MRIRIFIWCGCGSRSGSDFSPWCVSASRPRSYIQIKAQTSKKCSNTLLFHTFWLVICKLIRKLIRLALWCASGCGSGSWFLVDGDSDPDFIWCRYVVYSLPKWCGSGSGCGCGSGSTTLVHGSVSPERSRVIRSWELALRLEILVEVPYGIIISWLLQGVGHEQADYFVVAAGCVTWVSGLFRWLQGVGHE